MPAVSATVIRRVFKAFHYRDFRLMWIGAFTSAVGTWMQVLAQGWLIWTMSHSTRLLALDPILQATPIFLFSLVGGVFADRIERRHLLMFSQILQMLCALVLTFLVGFHMVKVWHFLTCSFVAGFAQAFGGPAYTALIPTLVSKEDMPNAIALNSIQFNGAVMIGPALGGVAMAKLGATWCFALNTLSFLAPVVSLMMLTIRFLPEKTTASIIGSMKEGIRFVRKQGAMEGLIVLACCMTALTMPMRMLLPVFATDVLHKGSGTFALFQSISGLGSVVGALAVAGLGNLRSKGRLALIMLICLGASISGFGLSRAVGLSCAMLFFAGAAMMGVFAMVSSLVQLIVTNQMRGRVMSVYNFSFRTGMPVGNLLAGWLVPVFTAPSVLAVNGALLIALGLYFLLVQRRVAAL
ncbi:MAG: MFS transporter [Bryobacteraceae bacterium]|jgi:predicted MFS family arabinose efflux permease